MALAGIASAIAGVLLLAWAWHSHPKRPVRQRRLIRAAGLAMLTVAAALGMRTTGDGRGLALALLSAMAAAATLLVAIGFRAWRARRAHNKHLRGHAAPLPSVNTVIRIAWISVLAGPLSAIAAFGSAAAIYAITSPANANVVTGVVLLAPLLWMVLALIATEARPLAQRTAVITAALIASLAAVGITAGGLA